MAFRPLLLHHSSPPNPLKPSRSFMLFFLKNGDISSGQSTSTTTTLVYLGNQTLTPLPKAPYSGTFSAFSATQKQTLDSQVHSLAISLKIHIRNILNMKDSLVQSLLNINIRRDQRPVSTTRSSYFKYRLLAS